MYVLFLYNWILCHSLLNILLAEIKINIPSPGYMTKLSVKLNPFIVKDSDKLKELAPNAI
jgi:hypothetical protein